MICAGHHDVRCVLDGKPVVGLLAKVKFTESVE
jgi:hypothetical protein